MKRSATYINEICCYLERCFFVDLLSLTHLTNTTDNSPNKEPLFVFVITSAWIYFGPPRTRCFCSGLLLAPIDDASPRPYEDYVRATLEPICKRGLSSSKSKQSPFIQIFANHHFSNHAHLPPHPPRLGYRSPYPPNQHHHHRRHIPARKTRLLSLDRLVRRRRRLLRVTGRRRQRRRRFHGNASRQLHAVFVGDQPDRWQLGREF